MFLPTSSFLAQLYKALSRRKRQEDDGGETKLARVLSLFDLTALGVGSTLGLGVYVLAGAVAKELAGPAVVISFLIAAIASGFSGLCYAEFAARVPKAGSAYIYSYVSIGEFVAFTIGWNLILEHVIGTASVARGMSGYLDSLFDKKMSKTLREMFPINVAFLAEYPDFFTLIVVTLLSVLLAIGVKESTMINNIFTAVNMSTIFIIIIAGLTKVNMKNWAIDPTSLDDCKIENCGSGGFMPFGVAGVIAGAAKCFYGFVGFDIVATTGEEAKNPKRNIPLSIFLSLIIIFLAYFGISTVLTMMVPSYKLDLNAPFPYVFDAIGYVEIKWVVTIGANFALSTALLGAMFPLPRILYSMASDGILYKFLQHVYPRTKTPVKATMVSGILAAILGAIFNLHQLIDMMSIGTLLAYTIVAICVLVLRYQDENMCENSIDQHSNLISRTFNTKGVKKPNPSTSSISKNGIILFSVLSIIFCALTTFADIIGSFSAQFGFAIVVVAMIACMLAIGRQPVSQIELTFKVPLVPTLPCLSVLINLYLMFQLDIYTWIRFVVWLIIGYVMYFSYGIKYSVEGILLKDKERNEDMTESGKTDCTNNQISGTYNITLKE
ncbi:high affinity cationic amino acid transporter 1-like [Phlebotomus papatasi]|uniref:high affinity cationic amino acid transporter 1-like n=1 Tax=Phlebotomus papatasi TaxID=29031 RepID=UPI002483EFCF|nr:high affinity cationic amino acid transporter 1-like [Phlebotomus papatasi]XP_055705615.1 high affinity cationic amino acid transporter 1-like [Phlebotomus papatasi]